MEKKELDKMEEALRNTTAGQFAELEKAIHQCAASLDDVCAIGIIKKVSIAISLLLALITLCLI